MRGSLLALAVVLGASGLQGQTAKPLWPGGAPMAQGTEDVDVPTLTAYLPAENPTKSAVVIAPGGSYVHLSMEKEGSDVAKWMNAHGVAAFVLKYRLGPKYHHPVELGDVQRAIRTVRAQAASMGIAPDHIGMMGFSAGGHLAATAGTLYDAGPPANADAIDKESARPDFLVLCYPVITFDPTYMHKGSRDNLLGKDPEQKLIDATSPEKHVTKATPPTFLFTTTDDGTVPVMNSILFYSALVANKVSGELHIYQHGPHGVGLAPGFPDLKGWPDLLATWMRAKGFMGAAS
jgi:acetyl esterase/lipase